MGIFGFKSGSEDRRRNPGQRRLISANILGGETIHMKPLLMNGYFCFFLKKIVCYFYSTEDQRTFNSVLLAAGWIGFSFPAGSRPVCTPTACWRCGRPPCSPAGPRASGPPTSSRCPPLLPRPHLRAWGQVSTGPMWLPTVPAQEECCVFLGDEHGYIRSYLLEGVLAVYGMPWRGTEVFAIVPPPTQRGTGWVL